jgi:micrococcal nuclease
MRTKFSYLLSFLFIIFASLFIFAKGRITLAPTILPTPAISPKQLVNLSYVIDGDTIIINGNKKVRYIGINTPELKTQTTPDECFARQALAENKKILSDKKIYLMSDTSNTDKYGRLLRYVYADNLFINDYLIRNGFAKIETVPPNTKYYMQFKQAEKEAKDHHLGLWSNCDK